MVMLCEGSADDHRIASLILLSTLRQTLTQFKGGSVDFWCLAVWEQISHGRKLGVTKTLQEYDSEDLLL
jgi:hypothetical protein